MEFIKNVNTPVGTIAIVCDGESIVKAMFHPMTETEQHPLTDKAEKQLTEYFEGKRKSFDLPLKADGTEFQKKVWDALLKIPYGETATYGEIAKTIGNSKACRAVGGANNKNPLSIFIPCHRCIGSDKSLVGYGGGLDIKKKLLDLEGCKYEN